MVIIHPKTQSTAIKFTGTSSYDEMMESWGDCFKNISFLSKKAGCLCLHYESIETSVLRGEWVINMSDRFSIHTDKQFKEEFIVSSKN